ncbi:hypothetical protein NLI96_g6625 [Meripilus lineatus]|uniref:Homeobox domain-containing protein n=1 Tax=Meripilus lineatus TaxID=2056292 RepID=A0AAD5V5W1_9APHY|nr:hypothetical protein NLI96_g6625 [Physisporinus lineatus]
MEIGMDVAKVTNWFRNLRQTTRKRGSKRNPDGDDDDDDDASVVTYTYSRDVSRAGSPYPSASTSVSRAPSPRPHDEDEDVRMEDPEDNESPRSCDPMEVKVEHDEKNQKVLVHAPYSRSHSDMGSDEDDQEAVTPSPSPPPSAFVPDDVAPKRAHVPARSPPDFPLTYAEMEKATAKFQTGVKVEDALLLLSFHHHVVR